MRLVLVFLLFFFTYTLSHAQEIKLLKKSIRYDRYYRYYPLKDFLVILTEYRRDTYLTVIDRDFNSKVIFIPGYRYPVDIVQVKNSVYAIIPKDRDFYCLNQIFPEKKELFCYQRDFIEKIIEYECSHRTYSQFITQDLNIGLFKKPRRAYSIDEALFCGKTKFKGKFVKLNQNKKVVLKKDFDLDYDKNFIITKYGLYAKKDKKLVFIDLNGKEKVIEKNIKKGKDIYIYEKNIYKPDKNCSANYTYLHCEDNTVIDLKTGEEIKIPITDYSLYFLCKVDDKLVFRKGFKQFYITDLNGKFLDSFTPKDSRPDILCINGILISRSVNEKKRFKSVDLFKIVE